MNKGEMARHMRGPVRSLAWFEGLEMEFRSHSTVFELQLVNHFYVVKSIW